MREEPDPNQQTTAADSGDESNRTRPQARMAFMRYAALGTELAGYALVCGGIGYAIDRGRAHDKLYATAAGTLIGFIYGMYRFVIQVQQGSDQER